MSLHGFGRRVDLVTPGLTNSSRLAPLKKRSPDHDSLAVRSSIDTSSLSDSINTSILSPLSVSSWTWIVRLLSAGPFCSRPSTGHCRHHPSRQRMILERHPVHRLLLGDAAFEVREAELVPGCDGFVARVLLVLFARSLGFLAQTAGDCERSGRRTCGLQ